MRFWLVGSASIQGASMASEASVQRELFPGDRQPRLLFCSSHCYWDPSSGAALCTRELLELLAERGWACRAFCGPHLEFEEAGSLAELLDAHQIRYERRQT